MTAKKEKHFQQLIESSIAPLRQLKGSITICLLSTLIYIAGGGILPWLYAKIKSTCMPYYWVTAQWKHWWWWWKWKVWVQPQSSNSQENTDDINFVSSMVGMALVIRSLSLNSHSFSVNSVDCIDENDSEHYISQTGCQCGIKLLQLNFKYALVTGKSMILSLHGKVII